MGFTKEAGLLSLVESIKQSTELRLAPELGEVPLHLSLAM